MMQMAYVQDISVQQLHSQLRNGFDGYIVDVREPAEVRQSGVIPGAIHIPLGQLPQRANTLPPKGVAVVVCRSGNRSRMGAQIISGSGREALNLAGGMLDWLSEGYAVEQR